MESVNQFPFCCSGYDALDMWWVVGGEVSYRHWAVQGRGALAIRWLQFEQRCNRLLSVPALANLAGGSFSLDAIGSYVQNAVSIGLAGNTLPAVLPQVLTATLSDDTSVMLVGKYSNGPVKLFAGYEYILYAPPSNPYATNTGFTDISGDFVCAGCAAINNTNINNTAFNAGDKQFHVFWRA